MYKCKICGKKYTDLSSLYNHIEQQHSEMIPMDMSIQQYYYYMKTGRSNGNCVMCKQPTTWNKNTNKYNRFCGDPKCKEEYVKIAKSRMIAKYGKVHLLNDPKKQREMLANRKISGVYRWSNSKIETTYTGSYELDFLKTLDLFFEWDPEDISMPSPHTYTYKYDGEEKFYIPDVFIHSLDLEIEIKDGGDNPNNHHKIQAVDKEKERLKDETMTSQKLFHYVKITNKNYTNFFDFLKEAKDGFEKYGDDKKIPRIFKMEDIKTKGSVKPVQESSEEALLEGVNAVTMVRLAIIVKAIDKELAKRNDKYKETRKKIQEIMKKEQIQAAIKAFMILKLIFKIINTVKLVILCRRLCNYITSASKIEDILSDKDKAKLYEMEKEIENKQVTMESIGIFEDDFEYDYENIMESPECLLEMDIMKNIMTSLQMKNKPLKEKDFFIRKSFNIKKDSPKELQEYLSTLIKTINSENDIVYIKDLVGESKSYYYKLINKLHKNVEGYDDYIKWVYNDMDKEIRDKMKKIKENFDINADINEQSEDIVTDKLNIKIVYNPNSRTVFNINDINSELIINEKYILEKPKVGMDYIIREGSYECQDKDILEVELSYNDNIELTKVINDKIEEGVKINSLCRINDKNSINRFIQEVSIKLFSLYPDDIN